MMTEYDHDDIEEIEITLLPVGFLIAEHVAPLAHQRTGYVSVNVCTKCGSIGADNFPYHDDQRFDHRKGTDECNFCGGQVVLNADLARWQPKYEKSYDKKKWFERRKPTDKQCGGNWCFIKREETR